MVKYYQMSKTPSDYAFIEGLPNVKGIDKDENVYLLTDINSDRTRKLASGIPLPISYFL